MIYMHDTAQSVVPGKRDITTQIGNTPLLRLGNIAREHGIKPEVEIYAKAEWFNASGSVKDRAALYMIRDGERRGLLGPGKTILDATSGNTGIAYAMIGAALGYRVEICLPATASLERKQLLKLYGAEIIETHPSMGTDGAIQEARRRYAQSPERYFYPDQYNNEANWLAHYDGTGPEIWEQTGGQVSHFVAVVGTSGTLVGTARRLKEFNPGIQVVEVQPDFGLPRSGGDEAHAHGDRTRHLRPQPGGRTHDGRHRGGTGDDTRAGALRGYTGRTIGRGGGARFAEAGGNAQQGRGRDGAARRRQPLPGRQLLARTMTALEHSNV